MYFTSLEDKGLCLKESSNPKMLTYLRTGLFEGE